MLLISKVSMLHSKPRTSITDEILQHVPREGWTYCCHTYQVLELVNPFSVLPTNFVLIAPEFDFIYLTSSDTYLIKAGAPGLHYCLLCNIA